MTEAVYARLARLGWSGNRDSPDLLGALPAEAQISIDEGAIRVADAIIVQPTETSADLATARLVAAAMLIAREQGHTTAQDALTLLDFARNKFSNGVGLT